MLNYKTAWLPITEVLPLFPEQDALIEAIRDGKIKTQGKYIVEIAEHQPRVYSNIAKKHWKNMRFNSRSMKLESIEEQDFHTTGYYYEDIRAHKRDLLQLYITKRTSLGATELHQAIIQVLSDVINGKNGEFPTASEVWNTLKRRKREFKCILKFEGTKKEATVKWRNLEGKEAKMLFTTFQNLIVKLHSESKPFL